MLGYLTIAALVALVRADQKAIVSIVGDANGTVTFTTTDKGVQVTGSISGLSPGKHGFHIHALGDISQGCTSTGGHFNPKNQSHGAPDADVRHVGDLGNIEADANGLANINILDNQIALEGLNNIIGRGVVVHADEDDLGKGGHDDSLTTGHAGARVGCGVIGILDEPAPSSGTRHIISLILTVVTIISTTIL
ncbi:superoxide dismutase [Cu-Zn]-like isoform X2 [Cylas formicarius]|uniref:superoxide dismutase [Cu-Zn]-like isoform X2 n=1 Tax=Cylas formicarius TaxID=197179 RepID=UPI0029584119|nr:superoxide dismutase [Cu-Zn]-like isoform X2 [Cylas formicarius]XP_060529831.1 superoxide dismutase [Cu-Zn]-like isoform X2 [Cylas formicarius]